MPRIPNLPDELNNFNPEPFVTATDPKVKMRQRVEIEIAHALIWRVLEDGGSVTVLDEDRDGHFIAKSKSTIDILDAMFKMDTDMIKLYNAQGVCIATVGLVYGNDGWDVIGNYSHRMGSTEHVKYLEEGPVKVLQDYYGG